MKRANLSTWWVRGAAVLACFTLVGLFFGSRTYILYNSYPDNAISWWDAMRPALVDWWAWAIAAPVIAWLVWRHPVERGRVAEGLAVHLAAGLAIAVLRAGVDTALLRPLLGLDPRPFGREAWISVHPNLMTYAVIAGLGHALLFYRRFRDRELRASRLEARLARAQLDVLRMQLNPHFLFNTLHAIGTLMHRDVDAAERMLTRLSDLLRATIEHAGRHEVSLRQEVEFLGRYLEVEQTRFADRLEIAFEIDPEALDLAVPYLVLQPLVENAIRHGIAPRVGPGRVEVRAERRNGRLELAVRDDGRGLDNGETPRREGVGLSNTRARLAQMYGDDHRFELRARDTGGVCVSLSIPAREVRDEEEDGT